MDYETTTHYGTGPQALPLPPDLPMTYALPPEVLAEAKVHIDAIRDIAMAHHLPLVLAMVHHSESEGEGAEAGITYSVIGHAVMPGKRVPDTLRLACIAISEGEKVLVREVQRREIGRLMRAVVGDKNPIDALDELVRNAGGVVLGAGKVDDAPLATPTGPTRTDGSPT